jgi:small subunit ribosomal protein S16
MKKMGRRHRPFYRICAIDSRAPRDGRVLEELGTYDPMVPDVDARAVLNGERVKHWLSVGAQPSEKVQVLIKKYGAEGTRLESQKAALDRLAQSRRRPEPAAHAEEASEAAPAGAAPEDDAAADAGTEEGPEPENG